jgi:hypothetical protein
VSILRQYRSRKSPVNTNQNAGTTQGSSLQTTLPALIDEASPPRDNSGVWLIAGPSVFPNPPTARITRSELFFSGCLPEDISPMERIRRYMEFRAEQRRQEMEFIERQRRQEMEFIERQRRQEMEFLEREGWLSGIQNSYAPEPVQGPAGHVFNGSQGNNPFGRKGRLRCIRTTRTRKRYHTSPCKRLTARSCAPCDPAYHTHLRHGLRSMARSNGAHQCTRCRPDRKTPRQVWSSELPSNS